MWPISATVLPAATSRSIPSSTGAPSPYANVTPSKRISPGPGGSSIAPGRSSTSDGSSSTSKMRSPDAVARCAWPIHIPSARNGRTSIARKRKMAVKLPTDRLPLATMRAPISSTAACATDGRNDSSGVYVARCRFAAIVWSKTRSER